jgi:hypothetical protein
MIISTLSSGASKFFTTRCSKMSRADSFEFHRRTPLPLSFFVGSAWNASCRDEQEIFANVNLQDSS